MNVIEKVNENENVDRFVLFGLDQIEGVGWKTISSIVNFFPSLQGLINDENVEFEHCNIEDRKIQTIRKSLSKTFIKDKLGCYRDKGIHFITIFDESYPPLLKQVYQPPWVLYYIGDPNLLKKNCIAMVGTRNPTTYGKRVADSIACALSKHQFCVVSGLARGIDSESHRGALKGEGGTIAVLGTGIDVIYPPEHKDLYHEISRNGLILSEFPIGTLSHPGLFPLRNRIISGLSLGTLVVEAALRSGSLITSDCATDQGRDVFAVPGPITSPKSMGAINLLKQGAIVVTEVEDIINEYKHMLTLKRSTSGEVYSIDHQLNESESKVYQFISCDPIKFDEILEQTKFDFGHLHALLLSLTLKNKIEQISGSAYVRLN